MKVAYLMSRFPRLTETFILYEILALDRRGCRVEIYPLLRERKTRVHPDGASVLRKMIDLVSGEEQKIVMHPEAEPLVARAHYTPLVSWPIVVENARQLVRRPHRYFGALAALVRHNAGSMNYLLGGLAVFPKAVYIGADMRRRGVTHLHAHFANHPTAAAFAIHRIFRIPYSFTGHGADLQVDQHMLAEKVAEASFVRAISADGREFIARHAASAGDGKLVVVPCGIDTAAFDGERPPSGRPIVLCVATMYEVKGHRYLFEAVARLVRDGVALRCLLVGEGPDRSDLERRVAELGIGRQVEFLGQRTRAEVIDLMHRADLLVVPSIPTESGRREGLPVVTMEALAAGLPVVASGISGIPEIVRHEQTGLLVPPADAPALAAAIRRMLDDPALRSRLSAAGRQLVQSEYDLAVVSERLEGLFAAASARSRRVAPAERAPAA